MNLIWHLRFKIVPITSEVWFTNFELLSIMFYTAILLKGPIFIMLISGNHEYDTSSKDSINPDPPNLSALSKVESNLIQNFTNLKKWSTQSKGYNLQDENKRRKTKVNVLENEIIALEIQNNNVDHHTRRNNVEISKIPQSVSDNQLEEKVVDMLKAIDVNSTSNEVEAFHHLGPKKKNVFVWVIDRKHCLKALRNKKSSSSSIKML